MQFVPILPTKHVHDFTDHFRYQFCLAHLCMENDEYKEVYRDVCQDTDNYVIMDNGAFEFGASIDMVNYLTIIKDLMPDEVVLPDRMFRAKDTIEMSKEFMEILTSSCPGAFCTQGVAQGRTIEEFLWCAESLIALGVDTIAIPKDYDIWPGGRELLAATLAWRLHAYTHVDIHLLGMSSINDPAFRWPVALKNQIRSMDSAKPGILACNNIRLHEGATDQYKSSRPENYFEVMLDNKQQKTLFQNLMVIKGNCADAARTTPDN